MRDEPGHAAGIILISAIDEKGVREDASVKLSLVFSLIRASERVEKDEYDDLESVWRREKEYCS